MLENLRGRGEKEGVVRTRAWNNYSGNEGKDAERKSEGKDGYGRLSASYKWSDRSGRGCPLDFRGKIE